MQARQTLWGWIILEFSSAALQAAANLDNSDETFKHSASAGEETLEQIKARVGGYEDDLAGLRLWHWPKLQAVPGESVTTPVWRDHTDWLDHLLSGLHLKCHKTQLASNFLPDHEHFKTNLLWNPWSYFLRLIRTCNAYRILPINVRIWIYQWKDNICLNILWIFYASLYEELGPGDKRRYRYK